MSPRSRLDTLSSLQGLTIFNELQRLRARSSVLIVFEPVCFSITCLEKGTDFQLAATMCWGSQEAMKHVVIVDVVSRDCARIVDAVGECALAGACASAGERRKS
jgi:hypothetical protein